MGLLLGFRYIQIAKLFITSDEFGSELDKHGRVTK